MDLDEYRMDAMRHLAARVDQELRIHTTKQARLRVLNELIAEHGLRKLERRGRPGMVQLTADQYYRMAHDYARVNNLTIKDLFDQGSRVLAPELLKSIGYENKEEGRTISDTEASDVASRVNKEAPTASNSVKNATSLGPDLQEDTNGTAAPVNLRSDLDGVGARSKLSKRKRFETDTEVDVESIVGQPRAKAPRTRERERSSSSSSLDVLQSAAKDKDFQVNKHASTDQLRPEASPASRPAAEGIARSGEAHSNMARSANPPVASSNKKRPIDQVEQEGSRSERPEKSARLEADTDKQATSASVASAASVRPAPATAGRLKLKLPGEKGKEKQTIDLTQQPNSSSPAAQELGRAATLDDAPRPKDRRQLRDEAEAGRRAEVERGQPRQFRVGEIRHRATGEPDMSPGVRGAYAPTIEQYHSGAAYMSRVSGLNPDLLRNVSNDTLTTRVKGAWDFIGSIPLLMMSETGRLQVKEKNIAIPVIEPAPELEALYVQVFGQDWRERLRRLKLAGAITLHQFLQVCGGAAIYQMVFEKPLPWKSPKEICAFQDEDAYHVNRIMDFYQIRSVEFKTLIWQGQWDKMNSEDFERERVMPIARQLAEKYWLIMEPQWAVAGMSKPTEDNLDRFVRDCILSARDAFRDALLAKGLMAVSPDHYTYEWYPSGAEFDEDTMRCFFRSTLDGQPRVVLFSATPVIKAKTKLHDVEARVASRAIVFSELKSKVPWLETPEPNPANVKSLGYAV